MAAPLSAKPAAGGRKNFRRTSVPMVERAASLILLLLIVVIGLAVYRKGKRFDPNLYAVRNDALKSTALAVEGKGGTAPAASELSLIHI